MSFISVSLLIVHIDHKWVVTLEQKDTHSAELCKSFGRNASSDILHLLSRSLPLIVLSIQTMVVSFNIDKMLFSIKQRLGTPKSQGIYYLLSILRLRVVILLAMCNSFSLRYTPLILKCVPFLEILATWQLARLKKEAI
jgi:hypothetical protein